MLIKLVVYLVVEIITIVCTSTGLVVYYSILFSELHFISRGMHMSTDVSHKVYIFLQRFRSNLFFSTRTQCFVWIPKIATVVQCFIPDGIIIIYYSTKSIQYLLIKLGERLRVLIFFFNIFKAFFSITFIKTGGRTVLFC